MLQFRIVAMFVAFVFPMLHCLTKCLTLFLCLTVFWVPCVLCLVVELLFYTRSYAICRLVAFLYNAILSMPDIEFCLLKLIFSLILTRPNMADESPSGKRTKAMPMSTPAKKVKAFDMNAHMRLMTEELDNRGSSDTDEVMDNITLVVSASGESMTRETRQYLDQLSQEKQGLSFGWIQSSRGKADAALTSTTCVMKTSLKVDRNQASYYGTRRTFVAMYHNGDPRNAIMSVEALKERWTDVKVEVLFDPPTLTIDMLPTRMALHFKFILSHEGCVEIRGDAWMLKKSEIAHPLMPNRGWLQKTVTNDNGGTSTAMSVSKLCIRKHYQGNMYSAVDGVEQNVIHRLLRLNDSAPDNVDWEYFMISETGVQIKAEMQKPTTKSRFA